jgi:pimeloyl-ACP methyl ester carboxylesterase
LPPLTPENVALALLAAAAGFLLWNVFLLFLARRYRPERAPDEVYRTAAEDGWVLELARYKAPARPDGSPRLPPVVCCHGLGANAVSLDMAEEVSLPRYLRSRGFDVWLLDLRGNGRSAQPPAGRGRYDFSFDDHATKDVKAAIEFVKRETGAPRVAWVGHSMGGIVAYGHVQVWGGQDLQAVATIASPTSFVKKPVVARLAPYASYHKLPAIYQELACRLVSPLATPIYSRLPFVDLLINARNAPDRYVRTGLAYALANMSMRLLLQFSRWIETGELTSVDGSRTYFRELEAVRVPWLAIAGAGDQLVPEENVRAGFERLGSSEKRLLVLGTAHGHAADYGHCDLVLGPRCREDVYSPVADFLLRFPLESVSVPEPGATGPKVPKAPDPVPVPVRETPSILS